MSRSNVRLKAKHLKGPPWRDIKKSFTFRYYFLDTGHWLLMLLKSGLGQGLTCRPPRPETGTGSGGATCLEQVPLTVYI
jgi:hypothetical protein